MGQLKFGYNGQIEEQKEKPVVKFGVDEILSIAQQMGVPVNGAVKRIDLIEGYFIRTNLGRIVRIKKVFAKYVFVQLKRKNDYIQIKVNIANIQKVSPYVSELLYPCDTVFVNSNQRIGEYEFLSWFIDRDKKRKIYIRNKDTQSCIVRLENEIYRICTREAVSNSIKNNYCNGSDLVE